MGRYGDPVGGDIHCEYCGYNHEPPDCGTPWDYMPSPETVAATDRVISQRALPSFIEVSYVRPASPDLLDQTRRWWIMGKKLLREDPFELDRWADDGGPCTPAER